MKKLLLLLIGVLMTLPSIARDFDYAYEGQTLTYTVINEEDKTVKTKSNLEVSGELIIPATVTDSAGDIFTVTEIGSESFYSCSNLTSVFIPNSVTEIGMYAFKGCGSLTSVSIPDSVTKIGSSAFADCRGLTSLILPNSITSISLSTFADCSGLTSLTIPHTITSIGAYAFDGCSGLTSLTIPDSVTSIGSYAFDGCSGLTSLTIPDSVISVGGYAFNGCSGLTSLTIGNSVSEIGRNAFYGCNSLTSVIALGEKPAEIQNSTFDTNVYANTTLNVPDNAVGDYLATTWNQFENITADNITIRNITDGVFNYRVIEGRENREAILIGGNYSEMTEATIPASITDDSDPIYITTIGPKAFYGCYKLQTVNMGSDSRIVTIGEDAFSGCTGITSITLPKTLKEIKKSAFYLCFGLTSIEIPNSVSEIGEGTFNGCTGLISIEIPNSVAEISDNTFYGCNRLKSVTIGNSVSSIGYRAFYNCSELESITMSNSVTSIGESAFRRCGKLTSLTMSNSVITIGNSAFESCEALTSVTLPNSVTTIGKYAFNGCGALTSLTIGNSVKEIGGSAFGGCGSLTSLTIPNSVTKIGDGTFSNCSGLTEIIVPPSVESIGAGAFDGASNLETIIMGHNVKFIGEYAFNNCPAKTVSITAQTPPTAPNSTFSTYGNLWLQDPGDNSVISAYHDATACWNYFNCYAMIAPTKMEGESPEIKGKPGETFQLTAKLLPDNVTLPQIFWRSTNPEIATVDENGLVTLHADISDSHSSRTRSDDGQQGCKIIAESLYANGPRFEVVVVEESSNAIDETNADRNGEDSIDYNAPYEVYNINGIRIGSSLESLEQGLYIVRQGKIVKKVAIR